MRCAQIEAGARAARRRRRCDRAARTLGDARRRRARVPLGVRHEALRRARRARRGRGGRRRARRAGGARGLDGPPPALARVRAAVRRRPPIAPPGTLADLLERRLRAARGRTLARARGDAVRASTCARRCSSRSGCRAELRGSPAAGIVGTLDDLLALRARAARADAGRAGDARRGDDASQFPGLVGVLPDFGRMDPNDWGLGFELRDGKSRTGRARATRSGRSATSAAGRAARSSGSTRTRALACAALTDREFGDWAIEAWPPLSDAVAAGSRVAGGCSSSGPLEARQVAGAGDLLQAGTPGIQPASRSAIARMSGTSSAPTTTSVGTRISPSRPGRDGWARSTLDLILDRQLQLVRTQRSSPRSARRTVGRGVVCEPHPCLLPRRRLRASPRSSAASSSAKPRRASSDHSQSAETGADEHEPLDQLGPGAGQLQRDAAAERAADDRGRPGQTRPRRSGRCRARPARAAARRTRQVGAITRCPAASSASTCGRPHPACRRSRRGGAARHSSVNSGRTSSSKVSQVAARHGRRRHRATGRSPRDIHRERDLAEVVARPEDAPARRGPPARR